MEPRSCSIQSYRPLGIAQKCPLARFADSQLEAVRGRDYDGLEASLRDFSRERSWQWKGGRNTKFGTLSRDEVLTRRDAVKRELDTLLRPAARCRSGAVMMSRAPRALRITRRGFAAIRVEDNGAQAAAEDSRDSKQAADLVSNKHPSLVAAARAKNTKKRGSATPCHARPEGFETGTGDRDAADPTGRKYRGNHEGDRLAAHSVRGFFAAVVRDLR